MNKSKIKPYAVSILLTLAVGGLSGFLTSMGMDSFDALTKPPLTPPSFLFPIVWTVLFILMGVGAARIFMTEPTAARNRALIVYVVQLAVNFFWSIIFFNLQAYAFAFFWLILLWVLILTMIYLFCKVDKPAALIQIPYAIWVTFAGYLNLMIWLMNR
ncbi:MAG: tryptophan-rich sensory protein [Oscillospiraceae bacterium]|nr:tryptophan-rich sensory protein [Oscillospiraceae bacterium]